MRAITAEIEEAAYLMGASRFVFWRRIGLPILAPSLLSAFLLLFANAMGTYATAWALVGGSANLVTIRIGELTAGDVFSDPNLADALAMLLVVSLIGSDPDRAALPQAQDPQCLNASRRRLVVDRPADRPAASADRRGGPQQHRDRTGRARFCPSAIREPLGKMFADPRFVIAHAIR